MTNLLPGIFADKLTMLTLMTAEADFVAVDPANKRLIFDDGFELYMDMLEPSGLGEDGDEDIDDWLF